MLYNAPHQFEPLLPGEHMQQSLLAKAHELSRAAAQLGGLPIAAELRGLLRGMNSYYTNRIEGQHTRPAEIEQALAKDFSANSELARRQRLAVAHIEAEQALEVGYAGEAGAQALYSQAAVQDIHRELFSRLPAENLPDSQNPPFTPGELRQQEVRVGRHVAPAWDSLPAFFARWAQFYGTVRRGEASLLALAAAHQRLGWMHPFIDGNGRVMRLHTHVLLHALGYSNGLWSPLRGFARDVERYYARLADADEARRGDLDGRGNLSEQGLIAWIDYVLDVCLDQVQFMAGMLAVSGMEGRIAACLSFEEQSLRSGVRRQALRPLHYLFLSAGELERGEFKSMLGLGERTAVTVLSALLKRGLLKSDSPQGRVRFGLPLHALRFYFPALWPEAEADAAG
ncbi:MAG: Fic family protein [Rhodocyclaceae bacterium]|nr:Fic family protein [Rhodocyclaceae bacterium]MBX3669650.1 Fic family protein [Rhodocyclaceae bacterium]